MPSASDRDEMRERPVVGRGQFVEELSCRIVNQAVPICEIGEIGGGV